MAGAQVSPGNSTIVPLGIGGVFSPAGFEDMYQFDNVCVVALSNVASAANGLVIEWSNDSTTTTITETRTLAAGVPMIYESATHGLGFKVSLTNGGIAQASLTILTVYRYAGNGGTINQGRPNAGVALSWPVDLWAYDDINTVLTRLITRPYTQYQDQNLDRLLTHANLYARDNINGGQVVLEAFTPDDASPVARVGLFTNSRQFAFNGVSFDKVRTPSASKSVAATAAGNTALWTPTTGTKFRLLRYCVEVTGNASQAVAGVITITLFDGAAGVTGQVHSVFVPGAAAAGAALFTSPWVDLGNGFISVLVNNVLNINLSAALATGVCRVLVACGEE